MKSNLDQKMSGVLMLSTAAVVIYVLAKAEILKAANAVNPLNPNNIFNTAAVSTYQAVTGSTGTIGTDIYGATHNYLKFPDGTVKSYTLFNPVDAAEYAYAEMFSGAVPSDILGNALPAG